MVYIKLFEEFDSKEIRYKKVHVEEGEEESNYGMWRIEAYDGKNKVGYVEYEITNLSLGSRESVANYADEGDIESILGIDEEEYYCDSRLLYVEKSYRKYGIGVELMNRMIAHAIRLGMEYVIGLSKPYDNVTGSLVKFSKSDIDSLFLWYKKNFDFIKLKRYTGKKAGYLMYKSLY